MVDERFPGKELLAEDDGLGPVFGVAGHGQELAEYLGGRPAENALGCLIPRLHLAMRIHRVDRQRRGLDDRVHGLGGGRQFVRPLGHALLEGLVGAAQFRLGLLALADVRDHQRRRHDLIAALDWSHAHGVPGQRAIRPRGHRFVLQRCPVPKTCVSAAAHVVVLLRRQIVVAAGTRDALYC